LITGISAVDPEETIGLCKVQACYVRTPTTSKKRALGRFLDDNGELNTEVIEKLVLVVLYSIIMQ
jgi:hypothetical protein